MWSHRDLHLRFLKVPQEPQFAFETQKWDLSREEVGHCKYLQARQKHWMIYENLIVVQRYNWTEVESF